VARDNLNDLSLDQLREHLSSLEEEQAATRRALEQRRQHSKKELAQELRELILSKGYDLAEIADLLVPRKRGGGAAVGTTRGKGDQAYARYEDPANPQNVYVRGVLPGWMKDQMQAKGLDIKNKQDRRTFKEQYLTKLDK